MKTFSKTIDKHSRKEMIGFLANHFRYNTMNSWNRSTSYAHNMKIHNLGLSSEITERLYDLIQTEEFYDRIHDLIYDFDEAHDFQWQAGFNGRSGGYLVLYQGGRRPSGYKSYCTKCGQKNYKEATESNNTCGVCRNPTRVNFSQEHRTTYSLPGKSVDMDGYYADWDMDSLRARTELVCEFDNLADAIVAEAVYMAEHSEVEEELYHVPQIRKVMVIKDEV